MACTAASIWPAPIRRTESYSRVVHYRINEATMTIEQVWEYGKQSGAALFSALRGSAYLLPNGDVLGTWGDICKDAHGKPGGQNDVNGTVETKIIEVDPSNNEVVFECNSTCGNISHPAGWVL